MSGIHRCISPGSRPDLCISTYIIPQVYLYAGPTGDAHFLAQDQHPRLQRRTPILIPILTTLGIAESAAVGTSALITNNINIKKLSATFSKDISLLQTQVGYLERQVDSLAEMVMQNRRGLDLLFLKQGGLCAALGETCCFCANHSGIIRQSMQELQKRLRERELEERSHESWYQSLFNWSPWLTTLISAIAGLLFLLLLGLTCGPIVLNKLIAFIKERVQSVKLMVLAQPYQKLPQRGDPFDESRV
uniref:Envelope glycoprotein n=1 Tax=Molossus molossus TaxID=27622 RepID=A0A7J8BJG8_MOLMO|nr:hypothetical protein HJG59_010440 [Molossus molossus]